MTIYELINSSLLSLFPTELNEQLTSYVNIASLVIMTLVIIVFIRFLCWLWNLFSNLGR